MSSGSTVNFIINASGNIQAVATSATVTNQQMTQAAAAANSYANALQRAGKAGKPPPSVGGSTAAGNALANTAGVGAGTTPPGGGSSGLNRGSAAGNSRGDSRDFARQAQGLGGLVHLYATFAANVFAVSAAFTALKKAEDVTIMFKTMNFLSSQVGTNVRSLATDLYKLTDAAISLPEAGKFAAMGSAAGMSANQMRDLAEGARAAAQVMGRDAADAMYRLTRAVTKIEPELIDELGILTKAGAAYKAYATQVNKSADDLTGAERQQAYATAVLEELKLKYGELYGTLKANPYAKLLATGQNAMQKFLETMNKGLGPIALGFAENIQMVGLFGAAIAAALLKRAVPSLTTFKENAVSKLDSVKKAFEEASKLKLAIGSPAVRQNIDSAKVNLAQKELEVIQRREAIGAKLLASAQGLVTQAYKDQNGITAKAIRNATSFTAAQENLKAVQNRIAQVSGMTNRTADDDKRLAALQRLEKLLGVQVERFKSVQAAISGVTAAQNTLNQANIQAGLIQNKHVERLAGQIKRQEKLAELARVASTFGWGEAGKSGAVENTRQELKKDRLEASQPAIDRSTAAATAATTRATSLAAVTATANRGMVAAASIDIQVMAAKLAAAGHMAAANWRIAMAGIGASLDIVKLKAASLGGTMMAILGHPLFMLATMILTMMIPSINKWMGVNTELYEKASSGTKALTDSVDILGKSYSRLLGMSMALSASETKGAASLIPLYDQKVAVTDNLIESNGKLLESIIAINDYQRKIAQMSGTQTFFDGLFGLLPGVNSEMSKLEKMRKEFNKNSAQSIDSQLNGLDPAAAAAALSTAGISGSITEVVNQIRAGALDMNKLSILSETLNKSLKDSGASARQLAEGFREANTFGDSMSNKILAFGQKAQKTFKDLPEELKPLGTAFDNIFKQKNIKVDLETKLSQGKLADDPRASIKIKEAENRVLIEQAKIFNDDVITALVTIGVATDDDAKAMREFAREITEIQRSIELFEALKKKLADLSASINTIMASGGKADEVFTQISTLIESEFQAFSERIVSLGKNSTDRAKGLYALETHIYSLELAKRLKLAKAAAVEEAKSKIRSKLIDQDAFDVASGGTGRGIEQIEADVSSFSVKWDVILEKGLQTSLNGIASKFKSTMEGLGIKNPIALNLAGDPGDLDKRINELKDGLEASLKVSKDNEAKGTQAANTTLSKLKKKDKEKGDHSVVDKSNVDNLQLLLELEKAKLNLLKQQTTEIESYGVYSQTAYENERSQVLEVIKAERALAEERAKNTYESELKKKGKKGFTKSGTEIEGDYTKNLQVIRQTFDLETKRAQIENDRFANLKREIDGRKNLLALAQQEVAAEIEKRDGVTVAKIQLNQNKPFQNLKDTTDKYKNSKIKEDPSDLFNPSTAIDNAKVSATLLADKEKILSLTNQIKSQTDASLQSYNDITLATDAIERETSDLLTGKVQLTDTEKILKLAIIDKNIANSEGNTVALTSIRDQIVSTGQLIDLVYKLAIAEAMRAKQPTKPLEDARAVATSETGTATGAAEAALKASESQTKALLKQKKAVEGLVTSAGKLRKAFDFGDVLNKLGSRLATIGATMTKAFPTKHMGKYVSALGTVTSSVGSLAKIEGEVSKERSEMTARHTKDMEDAGQNEERRNELTKIQAVEMGELNDKVYQRKVDAAFGAMDAVAEAAGAESETAKFLHNLKIGFIIGEMVAEAVAAAQSTTISTQKIGESLKETGANLVAGGSKMFAQGGWAGFAGVAAMLAVMAALGHRGGGGGISKPNILEDQAKEYGTTENELKQRSAQGTTFTQDVVDRFGEPLIPYQMTMVGLLQDIVDNTEGLNSSWKLKGSKTNLGGAAGGIVTVSKEGGYGRGDIAQGSWGNSGFFNATKDGKTVAKQSSEDNQGTGIVFGTQAQIDTIQDRFYKVDTSGTYEGSRNYSANVLSGIKTTTAGADFGYSLNDLASGGVKAEVFGLAGDNSGNARGTVVGTLEDQGAQDFANMILSAFADAAKKFKDILSNSEIMGSIGIKDADMTKLSQNLANVRISNLGTIVTSDQGGTAVSADDITRMVVAGESKLADNIIKQAFKPTDNPADSTSNLTRIYTRLEAMTAQNGRAVSENLVSAISAQGAAANALAGTGITLNGSEWENVDAKLDPKKWDAVITKNALVSASTGKLDSSLTQVLQSSTGTSQEMVALYKTFNNATSVMSAFGETFTAAVLTGAGSVERLNAGLEIMSERMNPQQLATIAQQELTTELPAGFKGLKTVDDAMDAIGNSSGELQGQLIAALPAMQKYENAMKKQVEASIGLTESMIVDVVTALAEGSMSSEEAATELESQMKKTLLNSAIAEFARLAIMEIVAGRTNTLSTTMAAHAESLTALFSDTTFMDSLGDVSTAIVGAADSFINLSIAATDSGKAIAEAHKSIEESLDGLKTSLEDKLADRLDRNNPNKTATALLVQSRIRKVTTDLNATTDPTKQAELYQKLVDLQLQSVDLQLEAIDAQVSSAEQTLDFYKEAKTYLEDFNLDKDKNPSLSGYDQILGLQSKFSKQARLASANIGDIVDGIEVTDTNRAEARTGALTTAGELQTAGKEYFGGTYGYYQLMESVNAPIQGWAAEVKSHETLIQELTSTGNDLLSNIYKNLGGTDSVLAKFDLKTAEGSLTSIATNTAATTTALVELERALRPVFSITKGAATGLNSSFNPLTVSAISPAMVGTGRFSDGYYDEYENYIDGEEIMTANTADLNRVDQAEWDQARYRRVQGMVTGGSSDLAAWHSSFIGGTSPDGVGREGADYLRSMGFDPTEASYTAMETAWYGSDAFKNQNAALNIASGLKLDATNGGTDGQMDITSTSGMNSALSLVKGLGTQIPALATMLSTADDTYLKSRITAWANHSSGRLPGILENSELQQLASELIQGTMPNMTQFATGYFTPPASTGATATGNTAASLTGSDTSYVDPNELEAQQWADLNTGSGTPSVYTPAVLTRTGTSTNYSDSLYTDNWYDEDTGELNSSTNTGRYLTGSSYLSNSSISGTLNPWGADSTNTNLESMLQSIPGYEGYEAPDYTRDELLSFDRNGNNTLDSEEIKFLLSQILNGINSVEVATLTSGEAQVQATTGLSTTIVSTADSNATSNIVDQNVYDEV